MIGWLAHDEDNKVTTLYAPHGETVKQQEKELAALIRRGLIVREIISDDARFVFAKTLTEKQMRKIAAPPTYRDDEGSAAHIAAKLVAATGATA